MSKRRTSRSKAGATGKSKQPPAAAAKTEDAKEKSRQGGFGFSSPESIRETIESVVIAFVLAFLFRTFEAEAFVIPTGSMAPTLMGRHMDLDCPKCDYRYQVGASASSPPVRKCICPMCGFPTDLFQGNVQGKDYESYNGDRILVNKFCYEYEDPKRWDVAVFKFPADAPTNYIKRVVGLPGETLQITGGDIYVHDKDEDRFVIQRKPPGKQLAMLQTVFDNDVMDKVAAYGWPARWNNPSGYVSDLSGEAPAGNWKTSEDYRSFSVDGTFDGESWMRYEHRVPDAHQWASVRQGIEVPASLVEPRKIVDFYAYNSGSLRRIEPQWVGDLAVRFQVDIESDSGVILIELVEGGRRFQCRINIADGVAALGIEGLDSFAPTKKTGVRPFGSHAIMFANCDDQLRLWVDGSVVEFDAKTTYAPFENVKSTDADLSPAGIGSLDAALAVSEVEILRDIYYISQPEMEGSPAGTPGPEYALEEDQFFMLGDNSPRSKDSRLWGKDRHFVQRRLMIGKAVFIYWPHSWDRIPGTEIPFPYFPNFGDMGLVR